MLRLPRNHEDGAEMWIEMLLDWGWLLAWASWSVEDAIDPGMWG